MISITFSPRKSVSAPWAIADQGHHEQTAAARTKLRLRVPYRAKAQIRRCRRRLPLTSRPWLGGVDGFIRRPHLSV
jgi:hypothetical protein